MEGNVSSESSYKSSAFDIISLLKSYFHQSIAIIIFLLIWEVAPRIGLVNILFISPPSVVFASMVNLILSGELIHQVVSSLIRVSLGFGLALLVALPLGFVLGGWFKEIETSVNPLLQILGQANPFTLFPVFMALLGIGEISKIAIIYWVCQWPVLFNTITGIKNVDPLLIKVARTAGLSKLEMFWKVLLPASLPTVFTGIRMGAAFAFFMLIGAEMIGAHSGLGFMIIQAQATFQIPKMYAGIVTVALLGIAINLIMLELEKRSMKWKEDIVMG
jgi:NitT/TauT family transport system permease protein